MDAANETESDDSQNVFRDVRSKIERRASAVLLRTTGIRPTLRKRCSVARIYMRRTLYGEEQYLKAFCISKGISPALYTTFIKTINPFVISMQIHTTPWCQGHRAQARQWIYTIVGRICTLSVRIHCEMPLLLATPQLKSEMLLKKLDLPTS